MSDKLIWTAERRKLSELHDLENNPRKIKEEGFEKLKERITKNGFHDVIKIDTDNKILSGNQRRRALRELKIDEVNVLVPSRPLTQEERDSVVLESNRHDGMWDFDILGNNFDNGFLLDIGFSMGELGMDISNGKDKIDVDNMASGLETYMNSDIKQVVLYFKGTEFGDIIRRLDIVLNELGVESYSEAVLKLLEEHETNI